MRIVVLLFCLTLLLSACAFPGHAQETTEQPIVAPGDLGIPPPFPGTPKVDEYLISTGDTLDVIVARRPELSWRGEVNREGNISGLPYLNQSVRVLCHTTQKASEEIAAAYTEIIKSPEVSVRVVERSTQPAMLMGAVRTPQRFQMQRDVRLVELLFISGGITDRASGDIQIFSPEPSACRSPRSENEQVVADAKSPIRVIRIRDVMAGVEGTNPEISPGDIVTVMAAEPVYLTGGVVYPQAINFRDELTLSRAIATVGGLNSSARGSEIRIYRRTQNVTEQEVLKADYNAIKKGKQPDIPLKAYDIIEVPQSSGSPGRTWQSAAQSIIIDEKQSGALPLRVLN